MVNRNRKAFKKLSTIVRLSERSPRLQRGGFTRGGGYTQNKVSKPTQDHGYSVEGGGDQKEMFK